MTELAAAAHLAEYNRKIYDSTGTVVPIQQLGTVYPDPLRLCKVNLSPIHGDLMDGVEVRMVMIENHTVKLVDPPPPPGFMSIPLSSLDMIDNGIYLLRLESVVRDTYSEDEAWSPFLVCGCSVIHQDFGTITTDKFKKHIQFFTLEITDDMCPYLQLIANHWRIKFNGEYYTRNDTLSIFFPSSLTQIVPGFIHVKPNNAQTIVPMRKGQRLNLLVDTSSQSINFDLSEEKESSFAVHSIVEMGKKHAALGYPLAIYVFDLYKELETNEFFEVITKSFGFNWHAQSKIVLTVSPEDNYGGSYIPVFEPVNDCRVYTGGYDGIKLRYMSKVSLRIHETCPARIVYAAKMANWYEYKISMKSPCHSLILSKDATGWIVKVTA